MNRPHVLTDARFHRSSDRQSLMNPSEVVVHMKQRHPGDMIIEVRAEGVSKPGKYSHIQPHIKILPLHRTRVDVLLIGGTGDFNALGTKTPRWRCGG
jgi:hypothetical protein